MDTIECTCALAYSYARTPVGRVRNAGCPIHGDEGKAMKDEMPTEGSRPQALQDGDLRANTLACEMADEWCAHRAKLTGLPGVSVWMYGALDRLEAITRESPLRKVRP